MFGRDVTVCPACQQGKLANVYSGASPWKTETEYL